VKICPACQATYPNDALICPRDGAELTGGIPEPGAILRQKYQLLELIGFGGMAGVYRARNLLWNEDCAIKILLRPGGNSFLAEARVLRRVQHPNIVRVEDADVSEDGLQFVVMEFIAGENLRERVRRAGPMDPEEALRITADVCSALEAAHVAGIIHRDIKPQNLLLAPGPDACDTVKVIDFGIAKVREEAGLGFTGVLGGTTGYFVGTLDYASPEQALGRPSKELDSRSDLYSLGLVLHEMLTGVLPFRGDTPMAVLLARLHTAPASPRELIPDLPKEACDVVLRALERGRDARYASAEEMRRACEEATVSIRQDRLAAQRAAEQQQARRLSARQKSEERAERWRQVARRLAAAPAKVAPFFGRFVMQKAALVAAIVIVAIVLPVFAIFAYSSMKYGSLIIGTPGSAKSTGIYAAPEQIAVGDASTPGDIASELRKAGYTESRSNATGYFQLRSGGIEIYPQRDSFFEQEAALIRFAKGKISQIEDLGNTGVTRQFYQLEPKIITSLSANPHEKRRDLHFAEIPTMVVQAVTSALDKHFFQSGVVELLDASSITQKLAAVLAPRDGSGRWMIALQLQRRLSSEQIFERYLNEAGFGARESFEIRGAGAASYAYLGKDIGQVNLPEAAQLAAMIQAPEDLDPFRHPDLLRERRNEVLGAMRVNGYLNERDFRSAIEAPVTVARPNQQSDAPYFEDLVKNELGIKFQDVDFTRRAYRVYTALDLRLQRAAAETVGEGMPVVDQQLSAKRMSAEAQVALVAIDPHTGAVKALIGGRNYGVDPLDRVLAMRQAGSIFIPFVYAAALDTAIGGGPQILTAASMLKGPANATLRDSLVRPAGDATAGLAQTVGYASVVAMAQRAGINHGIQPAPEAARGEYPVTPLEAAAAYTVFANQGQYVKPEVLSSVRDDAGKAVYISRTEQKRTLDPRIAYLMTSLLEDVFRSGAAARLRADSHLDVPAAVMTGASHDGWAVGFTSELLCAVWVGFDDNRALNLDGAQSAAPIWAGFMKRALAYREYGDAKPFTTPDGIVTAEIDPKSGMLATPKCPAKRQEFFIAGTQPAQTCPLHPAPSATPSYWTTNPAPAAARDTAQGMYWQVLATKDQASARAMQQTLKNMGLAALLSGGPNGMTRVLVGPYTDNDAMTRVKTQLANIGLHPLKSTPR
jgi:penicillin-binding protein 1B